MTMPSGGAVSLPVAAAYDAIAPAYDGLLDDDRWMRRLLWRRYAACFRPDEQVLDVACGTGLDTLFLARRGMRVSAVDVSAGMVERLRTKVAGEGLDDRVEARVRDAGVRMPWPEATFDGLVSAFAGLNTVEDLQAFAAEAARLLRPGGRVLLHMLAPTGFWEGLRHVRRHGWATARERRQQRARIVTIAGHAVRHRLLTAAQVYACFAPHFIQRDSFALGFLWPQTAGRWLPLPLASALGRLEVHLGRYRPFSKGGRFFFLELERR